MTLTAEAPLDQDEPDAADLAWARQYQRHPGKVAAARAYQARMVAGHDPARPVVAAIEAGRARRRLAALDVAMGEADRCRECGKALRTKASRAAGIGPECAAAKAREAGA